MDVLFLFTFMIIYNYSVLNIYKSASYTHLNQPEKDR